MDILPSSFWDFMYHWETSVVLFLSLFVQLLLVPMGLTRKHSSSQILRSFLLIAYYFSDWICDFSFVVLIDKYGSGCYDSFTDPTYIIRAFLAPFLLIHLGGSDTITAYSMEDNELWFRRLLSMLAVLAASIFIFLQALQPTSLNYVTLPVFVAGIIKYGEKIWALRSASAERLRDFLAVPTPSPITIHDEEDKDVDLQMLHISYYFFNKDKRLFIGLGSTSYDVQQDHLSYYDKFDSKSVFKIVDLELRLMYDFFYTKASINHCLCGRLFRITTISSLVVAFVTFCIIDKHEYSNNYVHLAYFLFSGAFFLEMCSLLLFIFSDWNVIWLTTQSSSNPLPRFIFKLISICGWSLKKRRCSNSISQYNLISHCLEQRNSSYYSKFLRFIKTMASFSVQRPISNTLETKIFQQLKQKLVLNQEYDCGCDEVGWSLKLDLDKSILLWHIATDICYRSSSEIEQREASKCSILVSNYLAYLLVNCPSLFRSGMSEIRHKATSEHVLELLQDKNKKLGSGLKSSLKLKKNEEEAKKSMLFDGCHLAGQLGKVEGIEKWEIIGNVWVELLGRISWECEWYEHAKQLTQGGSLLTRVWIFMHHLGYVKPANVLAMHMQEHQQDRPQLLDHETLYDYVVEQMFDVIFNVDSI